MASIVQATILLPLFPLPESIFHFIRLVNPRWCLKTHWLYRLFLEVFPDSLALFCVCLLHRHLLLLSHCCHGGPPGSHELLKRGIVSLFLYPLSSGCCASRTIEVNDLESVKKMLLTGFPRRGKSGKGRDLFKTISKLSCPLKMGVCIHLWGHTVPLLL